MVRGGPDTLRLALSGPARRGEPIEMTGTDADGEPSADGHGRLSATVRTEAGGPVVRVVGEIDFDSAPLLHAVLREALATSPAAPYVVVDLARVGFCDSAGLDVLIRARREALAQGRVVRLRAPSEAVAQVLRLTGVGEIFPVDPAPAPG